jgi:pimeloyl-ACP methyl ester carboxylesterase
MQVKYVSRRKGQGVWCFAEKGSQHYHNNKKFKYPTLVFLHGFAGDKDTWASVLMRLPNKFHSVVFDMPGYGGTTFCDDLDKPTIEGYVESVREFLQVTHLDQRKIW